MVQAEDPPSLKDVIEVKERSDPASILDGTVKPSRRLSEKTALSSLSVHDLQARLLRGQAWANEEFSRMETQVAEDGGFVAQIYDLDQENLKIESMVLAGSMSCKRLAAEAVQVAGEEEEVFLQTRTVSLNEVRRFLPLWIPSLKTEIDNFDNNQAIQRITEAQTHAILEEAEKKGERAELIPGMGVFTRKAGDGRRRSRTVRCGNYMEARAGDEVYASGADSTQLRSVLRLAALRQWDCLSLDVKSAFLLAPKAQGETVIVKPPRILEEAGLAQPGEHWLITSAMYGLVTSPKDWSSFRDTELQKMIGSYEIEEEDGKVWGSGEFSFRPMEDPNLWAIQELLPSNDEGEKKWGRVLGHMIVYVDDILMVGSRKIMEAASQTVQKSWSTAPPEFAEINGSSMRFLGMEIQRLEDGSYFLHQGSYVREVIDRHPGGVSTPFIRVPEEREEDEPASLPKVKEAQKITGELLWLSGKTRPDIAWAVMRMAQTAVKKPRWAVDLGEAIVAYLRQSMNFGLHYTTEVPVDSAPELQRKKPRLFNTVEVLVDASFGPSDSHSITGIVVLFAGHLFNGKVTNRL